MGKQKIFEYRPSNYIKNQLKCISQLVLEFRQRFEGQENSEGKTFYVFICTNHAKWIHVWVDISSYRYNSSLKLTANAQRSAHVKWKSFCSIHWTSCIPPHKYLQVMFTKAKHALKKERFLDLSKATGTFYFECDLN